VDGEGVDGEGVDGAWPAAQWSPQAVAGTVVPVVIAVLVVRERAGCRGPAVGRSPAAGRRDRSTEEMRQPCSARGRAPHPPLDATRHP
jgi:hypothetical protein